MELTTLLERMKMEHLLAQLDGVCEQAAKGDLDFKGFPARRAPFGCAISRRTPTCAGPGGIASTYRGRRRFRSATGVLAVR
jgi:hypothetical protein